MKIAVMGHGTIGRHVCATLEEMAPRFELKWILERPGFDTEPKMTSDVNVIMNDPEVELVCDILPGTHPSYEYIKQALLAGKHVVTVNKAALCFGFEELIGIAEEKGVFLRYEAACGGTIPDIAEALKLAETNEIEAIYGIMNGTTNFIIDKMDREGADFEPTLREAQKLGYAEANPTADLSGFDVRNKIIIISNTAYKCYCTTEFPMCGIEKLTGDILKRFKEQGKLIKLFGISVRRGDKYAIGVVPTVVAGESLEAHVPANFNMFTLRGTKCGVVKLYGQGAGGVPTADAVMRDICAVDTASGKNEGGYFNRMLTYDPSILTGTGYLGDEICTGTLEELSKKAAEKDCFFAFEPDAL